MERSQFAGMTTNERLFAAGLLEQYDQAKADQNLGLLRTILEGVEVDEPSIRLILQRVQEA